MWLPENWLLYSVIHTSFAPGSLEFMWSQKESRCWGCTSVWGSCSVYYSTGLYFDFIVFCFSCCNQINVISLHVIQLLPVPTHNTSELLTSRDSRRRRGRKRTACTRPPSGRTWVCLRSSRMLGRRAAPSCPLGSGSTYHRAQTPHHG